MLLFCYPPDSFEQVLSSFEINIEKFKSIIRTIQMANYKDFITLLQNHRILIVTLVGINISNELINMLVG